MIKSIFEESFEGKRVLVRVDFNVPLDKEHKVTDDNRIVMSLPTIDKIIDDGGIPILMSHLGRPKGERKMEYSLKPVADVLDNVFGYKVHFAEDCIGEPALNAVKQAALGEIVLLENLRFYKQEEKNDPEFAAKLAELADCYVNDAFGSAHRAHASTEAVAKLFADRYAGKLMQSELENLGSALAAPKRPFLAVIGGAKISGKIDVIRNLLGKCDKILIGGGMTFTFFKALGYEIGKSLLEEDKISLAGELIEESKKSGVELVLPEDIIIADAFDNNANKKCAVSDTIPAGWLGMDIGEKSMEYYSKLIKEAKTIVWNGPMGVFEMPSFAEGTRAVANAMAEATSRGAITVIGGGDSAAAINQMGLQDKVTHVSTGGGASLEFLEGRILPGVAALEV